MRKLLTKFLKRDDFHGLWEKMKRHVVVTTADCTYQFIKIIKKEKFCQMCKTFTEKTRDSLHSHKPLPQDHHRTINTKKDAPVKFEFVEEKVSVALSTYFMNLKTGMKMEDNSLPRRALLLLSFSSSLHFSILCRFPKWRLKLLLRHLRKTLAIGNWFLTNGALSFKRVSWSRWWKGMPLCLLQHSVYRYKQMQHLEILTLIVTLVFFSVPQARFNKFLAACFVIC